MKELKVIAWDDLHKAAGENVGADHTDVPLRLGDSEITLDLSGAHMAELKRFLAPYFAAGSAPETGRGHGMHVPLALAGRAGRREYLRGLRTWADATGQGNYRTRSGGYYYSADLISRYDAYLARQAAKPAADSRAS